MEEYWKASVGKKYDYFGPRFHAINSGRYWWGAWNTSALALGPMWMSNRHIPLWRIKIRLILCVIACLFSYDILPAPINILAGILIYICTFPLQANAIYKDYIEKVVKDNPHLNDFELKELLANKFETELDKGNRRMAEMRKPWG